jgi:hypothetical protein
MGKVYSSEGCADAMVADGEAATYEAERYMARCKECDEHIREVAMLADQCAFWAYQAKWYYAKVHCKQNYDDLPRAMQDSIAEAFERARIAENAERIGNIDPAHEIGS